MFGQSVTFQTVVSFNNTSAPQGQFNSGYSGPTALVLGPSGSLYGTTEAGGCVPGPNGCTIGSGSGTVFAVSPSGQLSTIHVFDPANPNLQDGQYPQAGLAPGPNGLFYGMGTQGGSTAGKALGIAFSISPSGVYNILYRFPNPNTTAGGFQPQDGLLAASDGSLYGQTSSGSANGCGSVFKLSGSGAVTTIYDHPATAYCGVGGGEGSMIQGADGNIYGTYRQGGGPAFGIIFKITPATGTLTTLYTFQGGCTDGAFPDAGLVQGSDGNLYGTTSYGGAYCVGGTIFRIAPDGTGYTILHSFGNPAGPAVEGFEPNAPLIQARDGNFYGTTLRGGMGKCSASTSCGTIFVMSPCGAVTTLYDFDFSANNSAGPWAPAGGLVQVADGSFYGMTSAGGANSGTPACSTYGCGAVYHLVVPPGSALGSPQITASGVTNAASFASGSLVPGSIATVFGANLASCGVNSASSYPLPTQLGNVSVMLNGAAAPLFAMINVAGAGQQQINFQVPWSLSGQASASLQVVNNGAASNSVSVPVVSAEPGIFTYSAGGTTYGAILHANYVLADTAHPAVAGETLLIYCTGLGAVSLPQSSGVAASAVVSTTVMPAVTIGGVKATISYSGLAPGFAGLYQINANVPAGLNSGNNPVVVTMGGGASNRAMLPVQ
jgi:uncharacterized protein (TIGR03437 family)